MKISGLEIHHKTDNSSIKYSIAVGIVESHVHDEMIESDVALRSVPVHCGMIVKSTTLHVNPWTAGVIGWISDSCCSIKPLCLGMGEVVPARTSPTLHPPSPRTVLSLSCFKVSQCINCHD